MNKIIFSFLLLTNSFIIYAQKEIPAFGKIDKADLILKDCEFDKNAAAYKLIDFGDVHYIRGNNGFDIETKRRVRIKILKDKGVDLANIKIRYYSKLNYENVKEIAAVTYNLDDAGNIVTTKLEKSSIYIKKVDNQRSEVAFTMPEVKTGSIIEYKFTEIKSSIGNIDNWYFQDDIPTRFSMYRIVVPSIFKFTSQVLTWQKTEQKKDIVRETMGINGRMLTYDSEEKTYILKNIPALRDEPYMSAAKDYLERVDFQLSQIDYGGGDIVDIRSTWPKLTENLLDDEDFGRQLRKNIPHTASLDESLKTVKDDYKKMALIHDFVKRNMNWNGAEGIYTDNGIKSAWDKKSGSNSEINLILINLLKDAGLEAYPLLVSTRDNGQVNTFYPFLHQFNNTLACVFIGDKKYILNGADKYNPSWLIPYDVINNDAFIVDMQKGGWIYLEDEKDIFRNVVSIFSEITPEGTMTGEASITSFGYSKNPKVKQWKEDKSSFKDNFSKAFTGMKIENIEVNNEDVDTMPLEQKVKFSLPLSSSGDYKYFTVNLFQGLEKNPFIADERYTDIDFGYNQSYTLVGKIYIPDGYEFEELPKNIKMIMPDTSIVLKRMMQTDENSVDLRVTVDFVKPYYAAADYPEFQEFYKKLFDVLNEQLVIKKKKVTP